jgi:hypothetical protein
MDCSDEATLVIAAPSCLFSPFYLYLSNSFLKNSIHGVFQGRFYEMNSQDLTFFSADASKNGDTSMYRLAICCFQQTTNSESTRRMT